MSLIPPQSEEIQAQLDKGNRRLLHCLNCGGQIVALRHSSSCMRCGSAAIVVERYD